MAIDNPVEMYLREVATVPLLTPVVERELIARDREVGRGSEIARKKLAEAHLGQVVSVANECSQDPRRLLDLILEGNIGLIKAIDALDGLDGEDFSTYAARYIRQAVADALPAN